MLRALGIGPGDEVITPPNSFLASAAAVPLVGARAVFVDVRDDLNIDPTLVETAVTPRTRAILPVHLTGRPAAMDALCDVARRRGLAVVEDAAQAVGARLHGRAVGTFGAAGCFSLHPLKNLAAVGDAGIVVTADERMAAALRQSRNHGLRTRDHCDAWSINARLAKRAGAPGICAKVWGSATTGARPGTGNPSAAQRPTATHGGMPLRAVWAPRPTAVGANAWVTRRRSIRTCGSGRCGRQWAPCWPIRSAWRQQTTAVSMRPGGPRGQSRQRSIRTWGRCGRGSHGCSTVRLRVSWTRRSAHLAFPGSGISANLTDKARKLGIPVWRFAAEGAA